MKTECNGELTQTILIVIEVDSAISKKLKFYSTIHNAT